MSILEHQNQLKTITNNLLSPSPEIYQLHNAVNDYQRLLSDIYRLHDENGINLDAAIHLPSGKALSTKEAARCLIDFNRTSHFIRGLHQGILSCQQQFPNEKIHILYAGTGPFAALALPMTSVFSPDSITFTFIEINPESHQNLKKTIDFFGISDFVRASVLADATQYIPQDETIHILLSETMQQSLRDEPQVAITLHLSPFLHPKGILIPEEITVSFALLNLGKLQAFILGEMAFLPDDYTLKITDLIHLNRNTRATFPTITTTINAEQTQHFNAPHFLTEVKIFKSEILDFRESQLTIPQRITNNLIPGEYRCVFQYTSGVRPGFDFDITPL